MPLKNSASSERPVANDACLVVIYGNELGRTYNLSVPSMIIGRSSKCEICVDQESISRNHSKIVNTGKSILIRDLGSSNGTYVNDQPIEEHVLRDGDLVKVGRTIFKFLSAGNVERGYHEEMYRMAKSEQVVASGQLDHERTTTTTLASDEGGLGGGGSKKRA